MLLTLIQVAQSCSKAVPNMCAKSISVKHMYCLSSYNGLLFEFGLQCRIRHIRGLLKKRMIFFSIEFFGLSLARRSLVEVPKWC